MTPTAGVLTVITAVLGLVTAQTTDAKEQAQESEQSTSQDLSALQRRFGDLEAENTRLREEVAAAGNAPTSAVQPTATAPDSPVSASDDQELIFDGEVTLSRRAAVDLDAATPSVVEGQLGPTGAFDLYHDSSAGGPDNLRVEGGSLFDYPTGISTGPSKVFGICSDYTGPSTSSKPTIPYMSLYVGRAFCFVTSSNHLAWANIEGVQDTTMTAVVRVRVWNTVVQN